MSKQKRKTGIFLLLILMISTLFPPMETQYVQAEESESRQLKNLEQGDEITFAGAKWIVLDPSAGYILRKDSVGKKAFDTNRSNQFNPSATNNLAHYLNGEYYAEAFTTAEQAVIEERAWEIGGIDLFDNGDESADQVNAPIGLLSYREWQEYSKHQNASNGFLENPRLLMWLRTPDSVNMDPHIWAAWEDGVLRNTRVSYENVAIHPALTLQSDLLVSDDNEVIVPARQLRGLNQGDEITFAGAEWIVLEPDEGYVLRKESIENRRPFDSGGSNKFDPSNEDNLAHYLNGEYYNKAFTLTEQAFIESRNWGIGNETNEGAETVEAKIGLLSYGEWREYSQYYNSSNGFIEHPNSIINTWSRTSGTSWWNWVIQWNGSLIGAVLDIYYPVHPALTLNPEIFVSNDNEVMVAGVTFDPNGTGDTWVQERDITINVKFVDMSEAVHYAWTTEKEKPSDGWEALTLDENGQSETIQTPEEATGAYYLHIQGKDIFSEDFHLYSQLFKLDNQNPTEPIINAPDEWTNAEVTVTIIAGEDDHSGVDETEYRLQEEGSEEWGDWQTLDSSGEAKIATEGETKLEARTVDQAGNQSEVAEAAVKIDQTKPKIAFDPTGNATVTKKAATKVTVTDELSGVDENSLIYIWSESDETPDEEADWEAFDNEAELTKADTDGDWYLHIQATDEARNQAYAVTNPFVLDNTPPEAPEIDPATMDWTADDVEVRIESEEEAAIEYQLNGTEEDNWLTYDEAFAIKDEGETTIYARAIDAAGNIGEVAEATVKIDRSDPKIKLAMTQGDDGAIYENDTWTNRTVHLSAEVTDEAMKDWTITVNGKEQTNVNDFVHTFSVNEVGTYIITVTAVDQAGNQAEETRTIRIDQTPSSAPSIQLSAEGWTSAAEVTATITAGEDGESGVAQTEYRVAEGEWSVYDQPLSITEAGETKIEARTINQAGNVSDITEETVKIKRTAPDQPKIEVETSEWTNAENVSFELTTEEADGKIEYQLNDTDEAGWLTSGEGLAITEEGITTIYARVIDKAGNVSNVVDATVKIDRTAPELTLLGDNPMFVGYEESFEDPGYEAKDNFSDNITLEVTGDEVDTDQTGVYQLIYTAKDQAGNTTQKTRAVHVVYESNPIITLIGDNPVMVEVGTAYEELGATATNQAGEEISDQITITDNIDLSTLGSYHVTYTVTDESDNTTTVTRTVEVVDLTPPKMTLNGAAEITLELGDSYQEAGAGATDNYDGNLNESIRMIGSVDTNETGTYHVIYSVTDTSSNVASVTRTIHVTDTTAPTDVKLEATEIKTDKITLTFSAQDLAGIKAYILSRDGKEIAHIDGEATTYTDQTVEAGTIYQYELEAIDPSDNTASVTIKVTTEEAKPTLGAPVEVTYVDGEGNAIADAEELTGNLGEVYQTEAKAIEGYTLKEEPANATGKFTETAQTVTYVYVAEKPGETEMPEVMEVILDQEPVEVLPGALVTIKNTWTSIQLPNDLPEGTLLQVTFVQAEDQEGLTLAGEVYDFIFTYPAGYEDYTSEFILTMRVTDENEEAAIYHYNEEDGEWQRIGGTIVGDTITATVTHFSMYGVFVEAETETEPPVKVETEEEEVEQEPKEPRAEGKKEPKPKEPATEVRKETEKEPKEEQPAEEEEAALPATATNQYNWLITGIILLLLGSSLWFILRKRKSNENHL